MNNLKITYLFCKRCFHKWIPRTNKYPKVCPKCNSPYWNKEYSRSDKIKEVKKLKKEKDDRDLGEITEVAHETQYRKKKN
jgi:hypothetical protein